MQLPVVLAGGFLALVAICVIESLRRDFEKQRRLCICGHRSRVHVSAWDWDSDYGDPQHRGPNYVKPGTCRNCRCRRFIAL